MYFFRDSSAKQLPAFKDPCFELAMARRKEEARWGWIPFAIFVFFLLVYRFFGLVMPSNNADGSQSWLFLLVLAGWAPGSRPHGCGSHLDADRLPSLLGGEPQGIGCCGAAVQHFGSC